MSKIAKEAALKALPKYPPETYADMDEYIEVESDRSMQRLFYQKGYEQAEKDTIKRTESHLESVLPNFLDMDTVKWIIKDFKKAMEEENNG